MLVVAATIVVIIAAESTGLRRSAWRTVYPHLPGAAQVLPYRVAGMLRQFRTPREELASSLPTVDAALSDGSPRVASGAPEAAASRSSAIADSGGLDTTPTIAMPSEFGLPTETNMPPAVDTESPPPADQAIVTTLPIESSIEGLRHEYQTWNNCGPATIGMAMSARRWDGGQQIAAARLKPDPGDKNVGPDELARFARESGFEARVLHGGTVERLQTLIASGFPVIVETWFIPEPGDEMGHYLVLDGYDSGSSKFTAMDSYHGPNVSLDWAAFDDLWRVFGRVYVVVYDAEESNDIDRIIGSDQDEQAMWIKAASVAQQEALARDDAFSYFNLGTALNALGDQASAAGAFDTARERGLPWRMLWYQFAPYEAYGAVGRWDDVLALADATLARVSNLEESLYWRGRARDANGDTEGAMRDWKRAIEINPLYQDPARAISNASDS